MPETAPEKPKYGNPCNGCGLCCAVEPCELAVNLMQVSHGPCPAMEFEQGRFWCGLARTPSKYLDTPSFADHDFSDIFSKMLGFGKGCDADD